MELQFHKTGCPYLQQLKREMQSQEQTQEIRLPDGMPDIGKVIGAWGQPLIRSKEWRSGGMGVSGGVMAWVLYEPEEGGVPQSVETWLPFQMKWDLSDTERDGVIHASYLLRNVDARSTSARKLMVRASVGIMGEALIPAVAEIPQPDQLPEDIQLLKQKYPVRLPKEAGERHFEMEEDISLPPSAPPISKLIYYTVQPEITEQKVMAGKVVFRGGMILHLLYQAEDGGLQSTDFDFPYSMYADLDRDYEEDASAQIFPMITSLELELGADGKLHMKAGLAGQYVVSDRQNLEVVEDAYSPRRAVTTHKEQLQLPVILDEYNQVAHAEQTVEAHGKRIVDTVFYPDHPRILRSDGTAEFELPGHFQMLYYDDLDTVQSTVPRWEDNWSLPMANDAKLEISLLPTGKPQGTMSGGSAQLRADMLINTRTIGQQGFMMVTGLEVGEPIELNPNRPSLLLRRTGADSLWDIAKAAGTTIEAIQKANHLQTEPESEQILLIPVP